MNGSTRAALPISSCVGVVLVAWGLAASSACANGLEYSDINWKLESPKAPVSISGDAALVYDLNSDRLFVHRFDGTTFVEEQELLPGDLDRKTHVFPVQAAIFGDVAVATAFALDRDEPDAAYVFRFDGVSWQEQQKLPVSALPVGRVYEKKGIALDGDHLLLTTENQAEPVHTFHFDGTSWIEGEILPPIDPDTGDRRFAISISISGDRVVVGAAVEGNTLRAYFFEWDGQRWNQQQSVPAIGTDIPGFGQRCSISGDVAMIRSEDRVHVYRHEGAWFEKQQIEVLGDSLLPVEVSGETAIVTEGDASARVFRWNGFLWTETQLLDMNYAEYLAMGDEFAMVGGPDFSTLYQPTCLNGTVNSGAGAVPNLLFVNGASGGLDRSMQVSAQDTDFTIVTLMAPPAGGSGRFALQGHLGDADSPASRRVLPHGLGTSCFPFFVNRGAMPVIVANNTGRESLFGQSAFFGLPQADPSAAAVSIVYPRLPLGTTLTMQAVIVDPATAGTANASTTNGVVVEVVP